MAKSMHSHYLTPAHLGGDVLGDGYYPHKLRAHTPASLPPTTSMAQHRTNNPKPQLFDLVHKWNLSTEQIATLAYYKLQYIQAHALQQWLRKDGGLLAREQENIIFVPIYQNTSRVQIAKDATYRHNTRYLLSFRATEETEQLAATATVLVQRAHSTE